jgi:hypothetical protein
MAEAQYLEKILTEYRIKKSAISVIRAILAKCSVLLYPQLWKLLSTFLVNAVNFFLNHDKDKKDILAVFKKHISEEDLKLVKSDLFECLLQLPSTSMYGSKFIHLLPAACEEIVSDETPENLSSVY